MPFDQSSPTPSLRKSDARLARLDAPGKVWAVGGLYGRLGALTELLGALADKRRPEEPVVFLGNYLGPHSAWTGEGAALIDTLISWQQNAAWHSGAQGHGTREAACIFLKGPGEDLLQGALRLAFQKNAAQWLSSALPFGLEHYVSAYGGAVAELQAFSSSGIIALNKLSHQLSAQIAARPGHAEFFANLKTAARTQHPKRGADLAFVPAGLDANTPLTFQSDALCWPQADIAALTSAPAYARIVRGQTFRREAPARDAFVLTLDDGMGLAGKLYAAALDATGKTTDWLEF